MNEANTQAEFYHHARTLGLNVELEMTTPAGRIDIAVLDEKRERIVAIVECKRDGFRVNEFSWQIKRYKEIGVPVYWLNKFSSAGSLAVVIFNEHRNDVGITMEAMRNLPRTTRGRRSKYAP